MTPLSASRGRGRRWRGRRGLSLLPFEDHQEVLAPLLRGELPGPFRVAGLRQADRQGVPFDLVNAELGHALALALRDLEVQGPGRLGRVEADLALLLHLTLAELLVPVLLDDDRQPLDDLG